MPTIHCGEPIKEYEFEIDGQILLATSYHPYEQDAKYARTGKILRDVVRFYSHDLHDEFPSMQNLIIYWIVTKNLSPNQHLVIKKICELLKIEYDPRHWGGLPEGEPRRLPGVEVMEYPIELIRRESE